MRSITGHFTSWAYKKKNRITHSVTRPGTDDQIIFKHLMRNVFTMLVALSSLVILFRRVVLYISIYKCSAIILSSGDVGSASNSSRAKGERLSSYWSLARVYIYTCTYNNGWSREIVNGQSCIKPRVNRCFSGFPEKVTRKIRDGSKETCLFCSGPKYTYIYIYM